jgi:hypothetical protein
MSAELSKAQDVLSASLQTSRNGAEGVGAGGVYTMTCHGPDGQLKWTDTFHNLVVNEGLQDMNSKYFKGIGYTATWYVGLVTGPGAGNTYAGTDTLATNPGWNENTNYTGTRPAANFGTATTADPSVISNSASQATFVMTSNAQTIAGALLASVTSGTSGILFSVGNFSGGDKVVDSGDTLSVTYQFSLDAV